MQQRDAGHRAAITPLERARRQQKIATTSTVFVLAVVGFMLVRGFFLESHAPVEHRNVMSAIVSFSEFVVTVATLALIRHQVGVAVHQIEQAEANEVQGRELAQAMQALAGAMRSRQR